jgi:hypothetical protein
MDNKNEGYVARPDSIARNKEFEAAAKALYHDWTPDLVHRLIDVVDAHTRTAVAAAIDQPRHIGMHPGFAAPYGRRADDFAKIVRASDGRQVLFFKDTNSDGNTLHAVADFGKRGQADTKYSGFEDADFDVILDRCDQVMADDVIHQTAPYYGGAR